MTHEELRELIAAYALDALAPEESRDLEAHLSHCQVCQDELVLLRDVAASLARGMAPVEPPTELRSRILTTIHPPRQESASQRGWVFALVAAAVVITLLGGLNLSLQQRLAALNVRAAEVTRVLALMASPGTKTVALTGSVPGSVSLVFDRATGQGALVVFGLRDPGRELVYQLWLVAGDTPKSAGVFRPAPDQPVIITMGPDLNQFRAVAISVERGPDGAPQPTSAPVLVGTIPSGS